jgi:hypothetical protein
MESYHVLAYFCSYTTEFLEITSTVRTVQFPYGEKILHIQIVLIIFRDNGKT